MINSRLFAAILTLGIHACVLPAAPHQNSNVTAADGDTATSSEPDQSITKDTRADAILRLLGEHYVYPGNVKRVEQAIRARSADFIQLDDRAYADAMRSVLSDLVQDRHLLLDHSARPLAEDDKHDISEPDPAAKARMEEFARRVNYGFTQVKVMKGNIGYLQIDGFMPVEVAGGTLAAAIKELHGTGALVIDLRESDKGGEPEMVALITAYLISDTERQLTRTVYRNGKEEESRIPLLDAAQRFPEDTPIYVLTSRKTFSAGEELAYNLKALGRARVIGEPTGGGANPGEVHRINAHLRLFVPEGEVFSSITGENWNWTGVIPHEAVAPEDALDRAITEIEAK